MRTRWWRFVAGAAVLGAGFPILVLGAPNASATPTPIKLALISSLTGEGASEFSTSAQGFLARIDLQNAQGGVNGHKIVPIVIDDQTSPTTVVTAVQSAISRGVTGIVSDSPLFFLGAKYAQQAGIPVTGGFFDGPEWGEQPYTNMFASDVGSLNPKYPVGTFFGQFMQQHGAKVIGTYGYGISPSSARSAVSTADAARHSGLKVGVLDTSVPFGSVAFGPEALVARSKHVDGLYASMDDNSNFTLLTAMEQAGVKPKVTIFPTGYEPAVIHSPAWKALQGTYFLSEFRPFSAPDAGTQQMAAALQKYEHRSAANFPTYNIYESWLGADLMIKGLQLAGKNPTSSQVIKELRGLKSYNGNGLLYLPIDYATIFGHDPAKTCEWVLQAQPGGFTLSSKTPTCGTDIPGTSTASSS